MYRHLWRVAAIAIILAANCCRSVEAEPVSLFADPKARNIGDVLTVVIQESASASNNAASSSGKSSETSVESGIPGAGNILKFIPLHVLESKHDNIFQGRASTSRSASVRARVAVTVVDRQPNGDLVIEGVRVLKINGEREAIALSGIVNPANVNRQNTVQSTSIADLQIEYTGKGPISQGARAGILTRVINWVF